VTVTSKLTALFLPASEKYRLVFKEGDLGKESSKKVQIRQRQFWR